jgi:hypothetical protein
MSSTDWSEFFQSLPTINDGNLAMMELVEASENTNLDEERLNALVEDPDTVIMSYVPPSKTILLLHHVTKLGGTRLNKDVSYVGLTGFGHFASPVLITEASLLGEFDIFTPTSSRLRTLTSPSQVSETSAPLSNGNKLEQSVWMILPPFLANIFMLQTDLSPEQLFIEALSAIQEFDVNHSTIKSVPSAATHCMPYLQFLWACTQEKVVSPLEMYPSSSSSIVSWSTELHRKHIISLVSPTTVPTGPVFGGPSDATMSDLSKNISEQNLEMERSRVSRETSSSEKKTSFANLFQSTQNMILNASSANQVTASVEPSDAAKEFYKQSNVAKARIWLEKKLTSEMRCHVAVNPAMVTNLYSGNFLRYQAATPSNFSVFNLMKPTPNSVRSQKECMMLNLKITHGKGASDEDLAAWTKQAIRICADMTEVSHAFRNTRCCASIFFKESSTIVSAMRSWEYHISSHLIEYEDRAASNSQFISMLVYAVDTRLHLWLKNCEEAALDQRDTVLDNLIDFSQMQSDILTGNFYQELPTCIRQHAVPKAASRKSAAADSDSDDEVASKRSKKPKKSSGDGRQVQNPDQIQDWIVPIDVFRSKFAGKNLKKRVLWGKDRFMCVRFHTLGYCFDDCYNQVSHVLKKSEIPADKQTAFGAFCKLCNP